MPRPAETFVNGVLMVMVPGLGWERKDEREQLEQDYAKRGVALPTYSSAAWYPKPALLPKP